MAERGATSSDGPTSGKQSRDDTNRRDETPAPDAPTKTSSASNLSSKAAHAAVLKTDLDKLEARLKRADTLTRNSIQSLETIVDTLESRLKSQKSSQKGQLTRHINILSARLDDTLSETRKAVRSDLQTALSQTSAEQKSSLAVLEAAINRASQRVDDAELSQADAITRINRHMADMARAVDVRINAEANARKQDIESVNARLQSAQSELKTELKSEIDQRVGTIERDSADALLKVGEKIEILHNQLQARRDADTDKVFQKVRSLAQQTEADFGTYREDFESRILELETRQDLLTVRTVGKDDADAERERDRMERKALAAQLETLQNRIEEVEAARIEAEAAAAQRSTASPSISPPAHTQPAATPPAATPTASQVSFSAPNHQTPTPNAPDEVAAPAAGQPTEYNPYAFAMNPPTDPDQHPTNIVQFGQTPPITPSATPPTQAPFDPNPLQSPRAPLTPDLPNPSDLLLAPGLGLPPAGDLDFEPAPLPAAPYANPAYAEGDIYTGGNFAGDDVSLKAIRVTDEKPRRKRLDLRGGSIVTGRTVRVALLATGVAVAALFAGKMVLGTDGVPLPESTQRVMSPLSNDAPRSGGVNFQTPPSNETVLSGEAGGETGGLAPNAGGAENGLVEPIGNYAESQPIIIDGDEIDTLEAAVAAGDPIAQYQMGIAQLESGDTEAGAQLIIQAADAGQPAALYRLAKLHEAGIGVPQNDARARQLVEQAARGGNRIAMHDLALYFAEGRGGVDVNMATARSWFEQAAQRGVLDSQYNLAVLSESPDTGLRADPEAAYFWYSIAANQGDQFAMGRRDTLLASLDESVVARLDNQVNSFTPRDVDEAANGIFRDLPWIQNPQTADADVKAQVQSVQTLLTDLGFDVGGADGLMGEKTRTAIIAFERANGLPQTGRVNSNLISRLERAAGV